MTQVNWKIVIKNLQAGNHALTSGIEELPMTVITCSHFFSEDKKFL